MALVGGLVTQGHHCLMVQFVYPLLHSASECANCSDMNLENNRLNDYTLLTLIYQVTDQKYLLTRSV